MITALATTFNTRCRLAEVNGRDKGINALEPDRRRCKLLLIEDNPLEARLLQRALIDSSPRSRTALRFEIVHAERMSKACQILESQNIDIVLLDSTLPDATGLENIDRIRNAGQNLPIILMSSFDDATLVADAVRRGAHDCLVKNRYDGVHLARTIGHAVERHALRSEIARQADEIVRREVNFQNIIAAARDGMIILDREGTIQFMNPAAEALLGPNARKQVEHHFSPTLIPAGAIELELANSAGSLVTLELSATGIEWEGASAQLITARDITAHKQIENEKRLLEQRLLESQRLESLGVMASSIVHDFNNLLTAILGSAGSAQMDLPTDSPTREDLQQIESSCHRASELCQQMLAYSAGRSAAGFKPIHLNNLVRETSTLLRHSISKRVEVIHKFSDDLPFVLGDETQIRQIIMNLVINASEAISGKNGRIHIRTVMAPSAPDMPGRFIQLEVTDDGCGMPADVQKKIFDPFFSTKNSGRGVGLSAVAQIIKKHNGTISVTSQPNRGTTFRILLPCTNVRQQAPALPTTPATTWRSKGTVLLVDDEKDVRTAIARMLKQFGFETVIAHDGRDALNKFRVHANKIDYVLMDLTMPQLDGEEACTELLRLQPNLPIVLMSGFAEQDACRRFGGKGLADFLQKPFNHVELEQVLRPLTERRAAA